MCNLTDGYFVVKWVFGGGPKQPGIPVCITVVRRPRKETGLACY